MSNDNISDSDSEFTNFVKSLLNYIPEYFAYSVPWCALMFNLFALGVLFLVKRTPIESSIIIYLYKWQYTIGTIYVFNILFNDPIFSAHLLGYKLTVGVSDSICKLSRFLLRYIYCLSPWMQVVFALDRFWSVFLSNRIRIKRNNRNLTFLIIIVFALIGNVNLFNIFFYGAKQFRYPTFTFSNRTNQTIIASFSLITGCSQSNPNLLAAQELVFNLFRSVIPFVFLLYLSILLLIKLWMSRRTITSSTNLLRNNNNERRFTISVCLIIGSFLFFNLPYLIYLLISIPSFLNSTERTSQQQSELVLYEMFSLLLSYMFVLLEFWRDLILNRLFRKEVRKACLILIGCVDNRIRK